MIRLAPFLALAVVLVCCAPVSGATSPSLYDATDAEALAADPGALAPACDRACHALFVAACSPLATCPSACASAQALGLVALATVECIAAAKDHASALACGGGFCH